MEQLTNHKAVMLRVNQVAKLYGISTSTVWRLVANGKLKTISQQLISRFLMLMR